jgi:hypothetical protein
MKTTLPLPLQIMRYLPGGNERARALAFGWVGGWVGVKSCTVMKRGCVCICSSEMSLYGTYVGVMNDSWMGEAGVCWCVLFVRSLKAGTINGIFLAVFRLSF